MEGRRLPATKKAAGLGFTLGEVTVQAKPYNPTDIWTQTITIPFRVQTNGVTLAQWEPAYLEAEDESGNRGINSSLVGVTDGWSIRKAWRGPDPRKVWRLDVKFEERPAADATNVFSVSLPALLPGPTVTSLAGVEVTISGDIRERLDVSIRTNRTDVALKFISAKTKEERKSITRTFGSWSQHRFLTRFDLSPGDSLAEAVIAIVPTVHQTFYTQPRLIANDEGSRTGTGSIR